MHIGGLLVFGANEVIYLNQATPPYSLLTNAQGKQHTRHTFRMFSFQRGLSL